MKKAITILMVAGGLALVALGGVAVGQVEKIPVGNHYLCYHAEGDTPREVVQLFDEFYPDGLSRRPTVGATRWLCNPTEKHSSEGIFRVVDPDLHYVCYLISPEPRGKDVVVFNQFVPKGDELDVTRAQLLCVPTKKIDP